MRGAQNSQSLMLSTLLHSSPSGQIPAMTDRHHDERRLGRHPVHKQQKPSLTSAPASVPPSGSPAPSLSSEMPVPSSSVSELALQCLGDMPPSESSFERGGGPGGAPPPPISSKSPSEPAPSSRGSTVSCEVLKQAILCYTV